LWCGEICCSSNGNPPTHIYVKLDSCWYSDGPWAGQPVFNFWQGKDFTPQHPDHLWGSPNLLVNGYLRLFSWVLNGWIMQLTTPI
jgi:hypothetical protein